MKTIQECLREADEKELIGSYRYKYQLDYIDVQMLNLENVTYAEIKKRETEALSKAIGIMRTLPLTATDDPLVLYALREIQAGENHLSVNEKTCFSFCRLKEIKENPGDAKDYDVSFTPWSQSLAYLVSDAPLTQVNLCEALSTYLREALMFGMTPEKQSEGTERMINALNKAEEEAEEGKWCSLEETEESIFGKELICERRRTRSAEAEEDLRRISESAYKFYLKYREEERRKIFEDAFGQKEKQTSD